MNNLNTLSIFILAITTIVISTVNMNQNNEIEMLKSRIIALEETK